jgi:flagellar hook-associated protein 2
MSDFSSIPGVGSNKYGTDKIIEGLMKLERIPRDKAQERIDSYQKEKTVWTDVGREVSSLRGAALALYDSRNPFGNRVGTSSSEEVLTASATRQASEQSRQILVKQVAAADIFSSASLPKDWKVAAGNYLFKIGEGQVELRFPGGGLQEFADAVNRKGRDLLRAAVVPVTTEKRSLVIEALKTGASNRLAFSSPDTEKLALEAGILERVGTRSAELDKGRPQAWTRPLDPRLVTQGGDRLLVATGGEGKLLLPSPQKTAGLVLELRYRIVDLPEAPLPTEPPGPAVTATGEASYKGIRIESAPSEAALPAWEAPPSPPRVDDLSMLSLLGPGGAAVPLPALDDTGESASLRVELGALLPELSALAFRNRDTGRRLELLGAKVYDPEETGGWKPKQAISTARDAILALDGLEVTRPSNAIDDLIPGVTLNLKEASEKAVRLKIEPDREAVKAGLYAFVNSYNRVMATINILTRSDPAILSEMDFETEAEKKTATERLGLLQGDSTLSFIKSKMQTLTIAPYPTDAGGEMSILAQLGISTNSGAAGSQGYSAAKMRGYLDVDEAKMDAALTARFEAASQLFAYDTDGDLIKDTGVAKQLDLLLTSYVQTGGLFANRGSTLDRQISAEKKSIEALDVKLARTEAELRRTYGMMEGSLSRMEGTSSSIDQFSQNNSGQ